MRPNPLLLSIIAALSGCGEETAEETFDAQGCISATADQTSCPAAGDVRIKDVWLRGRCGDDLEVTAVKSGGTLESIVEQDGRSFPACCYLVEVIDHDEKAECAVGRPYYEMPSITSRICGICPVSHLLASSKACDEIMAVRVPATGALRKAQ